MQPRSIEERVTMLERQMQEMRDLPERVTNLELQIVQLRQEMRDEFSAVRSELRGEVAGAVTTLRGEIAAAVTTLTNALADTNRAIADTNTHMRALHEEALSRIATIGEGRRPRKKR
jgi:hypothetical protein